MIFTKTKYLGMAMTLACSTALAQHNRLNVGMWNLWITL